jgi:hypothetical protein
VQAVEAAIEALDPGGAGLATEIKQDDIITKQGDGNQKTQLVQSDGSTPPLEAGGDHYDQQTDIKAATEATQTAVEAGGALYLLNDAIRTATEALAAALTTIGAVLGTVKGLAVLGSDGANWRALLTNAAGNLIPKSPIAADFLVTEASAAAIAASLVTAAGARTFTKISVTWTADDGTAEVEMTLAAGTYWVHAVGFENAVAAGSATFQIHGSTETGFTPGANREEFYTSTAGIALPNGGYDAFLAPIPITVPVAAKVYWRIVPNAGTTTGALDLYHTLNQ